MSGIYLEGGGRTHPKHTFFGARSAPIVGTCVRIRILSRITNITQYGQFTRDRYYSYCKVLVPMAGTDTGIHRTPPKTGVISGGSRDPQRITLRPLLKTLYQCCGAQIADQRSEIRWQDHSRGIPIPIKYG